jgi:hypothetical protein
MKPFLSVIIICLATTGEEMRLKVVDRYGGIVVPYALEAHCPNSTWNVTIKSATNAPAVSQLVGCSGRITTPGFRARSVKVGEFEGSVISLAIAAVGDPSPLPMSRPTIITIDPQSKQQRLPTSLLIRLLFKYGDELYTAPVDPISGTARFSHVPEGLYELVVQHGSKITVVTELLVRELEREIKVTLPPKLALVEQTDRPRR